MNIEIGKIVVTCKTSRRPPLWEISVQLAVAGDVCGGVFLCCPFSHEMSLLRFWTLLGQFLGVFLPAFIACLSVCPAIT